MKRLATVRRSWLRLCGGAALTATLLCADGPWLPMLRAQSIQPKTPSPDERLEEYLETTGLHDLLTLQLEQRRATPEGSKDSALGLRLAEVYATALDETEDPLARVSLEERAAGLLIDIPEGESAGLRLALARSAYRRAEETAEKWRLRFVGAGESDAAFRTFIDLLPALTEIATRTGQRIGVLERQEEALDARDDRAMLTKALASLRRTRSMAQFLAGWCCIYAAELKPASASQHAQAALVHFGWLLNAKPGDRPTIDRVPEQLLEYEHVQRAVIGTAAAHGLLGDDVSALRWLEILEDQEGVTGPVAGQLRLRHLVILAGAGRWADALGLFTVSGEVRGISPIEARLAAVLALEAKPAPARGSGADADPALARLLEQAMTSLALRGQVAQVLDLASKYFERLDQFGSGGFMPAYIRGLREYDRARRAHGEAGDADDQPSRSKEARAAFEAAAGFFQSAEDAADASRFAAALPGLALLRARSAYHAAQSVEELDAAARMFESASTRLSAVDPRQAAFALRMATHALRTAIDAAKEGPANGKTALRARHQGVIDEFLHRFPTDPAAARMLYERALSGSIDADRAVGDLLSLASSEASGAMLASAARYQASRLLYEQFLRASPGQKPSAAVAFLEIGDPIVEDSFRLGPDSAKGEIDQAALTARRVLDCLLSVSVGALHRAERALDLIDNMIARGMIASGAIGGEIAYRRVQLAVARGRNLEAEAALENLRAIDPKLGEVALRMLFQTLADRWSASESGDRLEAAADIVRLGQRVMAGLPAAPEALRDPGATMVYFTTAKAAAGLSIGRGGDDDARGLAEKLFGALLESYPRDPDILRSAATFREDSGDHAGAAAAWHTLSLGIPQGDPDWFEARVRSIEQLARGDPGAAARALTQHRVLFPDLGPAPWDDRLRALAEAIGSPADSVSPEGGEP